MCAVNASSMTRFPASVSAITRPRASSSLTRRETRPAASSRSIRLVAAPVVTIVCRASSPGASSYGAPGAAQRRQHVELPLPQPEPAELDLQLLAQPVGQPVQPAVDALRGDVEVGALPLPLRLDPSDVIDDQYIFRGRNNIFHGRS